MDTHYCHEGWIKTRTPTSIEEWKWMAKTVWATNYDFSKPLEMKKKRKRRSKFQPLQSSLCGNKLRQTSDDLDRRPTRTKKQKGNNAKRTTQMAHKRIVSPRKRIQLFVSTPLSTTLNFSVLCSTYVRDLKQRIGESLGIATEKQDLFVGSLKMSNLLTLADHGVKDQSNIELKLCAGLLGGADRPYEAPTREPNPPCAATQGEQCATASDTSDSTSNAARSIHVEGNYNISVTAGDNSTVNITRSEEVYEMKIRIDANEERTRGAEERSRGVEERLRRFEEKLEKQQEEQDILAAEHNRLLQIVAEHSPELLDLYLRKGIGRLDRIGPGSVYLYIRFSLREELENLWTMYDNGELRAEMNKILNRKKSHGVDGNMEIQVYISHEDYLRGIEVFKQQGVIRGRKMNGLLMCSVTMALLLGAHVDAADKQCYVCVATCPAPADFDPKGTGVTKVSCPVGKCFTKKTTVAGVDTYARGCEPGKLCDDESTSCCDENLCNNKSQTLKSGASILTGMTLIGTTLVMVASAIVLN